MGYLNLSVQDAAKIIENTRSNKIIKTEVHLKDSKNITENIGKDEAIRLVKKASSIFYNEDEFVGNIDLSFNNDSISVKLLLGN